MDEQIAGTVQAEARNARIDRKTMQEAVAELTFFAVEGPLAESELVAAFATAFESHAFASFTIEGLTAGLARTLPSCGNRVRGYLDAYVHRFLHRRPCAPACRNSP